MSGTPTQLVHNEHAEAEKVVGKILEFEVFDPVWFELIRRHPELQANINGTKAPVGRNYKMNTYLPRKKTINNNEILADLATAYNVTAGVSVTGIFTLYNSYTLAPYGMATLDVFRADIARSFPQIDEETRLELCPLSHVRIPQHCLFQIPASTIPGPAASVTTLPPSAGHAEHTVLPTKILSSYCHSRFVLLNVVYRDIVPIEGAAAAPPAKKKPPAGKGAAAGTAAGGGGGGGDARRIMFRLLVVDAIAELIPVADAQVALQQDETTSDTSKEGASIELVEGESSAGVGGAGVGAGVGVGGCDEFRAEIAHEILLDCNSSGPILAAGINAGEVNADGSPVVSPGSIDSIAELYDNIDVTLSQDGCFLSVLLGNNDSSSSSSSSSSSGCKIFALRNPSATYIDPPAALQSKGKLADIQEEQGEMQPNGELETIENKAAAALPSESAVGTSSNAEAEGAAGVEAEAEAIPEPPLRLAVCPLIAEVPADCALLGGHQMRNALLIPPPPTATGRSVSNNNNLQEQEQQPPVESPLPPSAPVDNNNDSAEGGASASSAAPAPVASDVDVLAGGGKLLVALKKATHLLVLGFRKKSPEEVDALTQAALAAAGGGGAGGGGKKGAPAAPDPVALAAAAASVVPLDVFPLAQWSLSASLSALTVDFSHANMPLLATGASDGTAALWNLADHALVDTLGKHSAPVTCLSIQRSPPASNNSSSSISLCASSLTVISGAADGTLCFYAAKAEDQTVSGYMQQQSAQSNGRGLLVGDSLAHAPSMTASSAAAPAGGGYAAVSSSRRSLQRIGGGGGAGGGGRAAGGANTGTPGAAEHVRVVDYRADVSNAAVLSIQRQQHALLRAEGAEGVEVAPLPVVFVQYSSGAIAVYDVSNHCATPSASSGLDKCAVLIGRIEKRQRINYENVFSSFLCHRTLPAFEDPIKKEAARIAAEQAAIAAAEEAEAQRILTEQQAAAEAAKAAAKAGKGGKAAAPAEPVEAEKEEEKEEEEEVGEQEPAISEPPPYVPSPPDIQESEVDVVSYSELLTCIGDGNLSAQWQGYRPISSVGPGHYICAANRRDEALLQAQKQREAQKTSKMKRAAAEAVAAAGEAAEEQGGGGGGPNEVGGASSEGEEGVEDASATLAVAAPSPCLVQYCLPTLLQAAASPTATTSGFAGGTAASAAAAGVATAGSVGTAATGTAHRSSATGINSSGVAMRKSNATSGSQQQQQQLRLTESRLQQLESSFKANGATVASSGGGYGSGGVGMTTVAATAASRTTCMNTSAPNVTLDPLTLTQIGVLRSKNERIGRKQRLVTSTKTLGNILRNAYS
mmetsp:Transcript_18639/g.31256  ORF Transcript_18639/g.31256 Transcript_18639/m.31256 type:complete len:1322 (-) Transcript_18639:75-4040(-)